MNGALCREIARIGVMHIATVFAEHLLKVVLRRMFIRNERIHQERIFSPSSFCPKKIYLFIFIA